MLPKLCRDGLLYALALYLFQGLRSDFDHSHWPVGLRWILVVTWVSGMVGLAEIYRARAKRTRAREAWPPQE